MLGIMHRLWFMLSSLILPWGARAEISSNLWEELPFLHFPSSLSPIIDLSTFMPFEMTFSNSFPVKSYLTLEGVSYLPLEWKVSTPALIDKFIVFIFLPTPSAYVCFTSLTRFLYIQCLWLPISYLFILIYFLSLSLWLFILIFLYCHVIPRNHLIQCVKNVWRKLQLISCHFFAYFLTHGAFSSSLPA